MQRKWYDAPLLLLGLVWFFFGLGSYILVSSVGAPVMPYTGLIIATLGLWIGLVRPLWAASQPPPPSE